jgi:hypothetical protein
MSKRSLIYAHIESVAMNVPNFMTLRNPQLQNMQISHFEIHPNRKYVLKEGKEIILHPYVKYGIHCTYFCRTHKYSINLCRHLVPIIIQTGKKNL